MVPRCSKCWKQFLYSQLHYSQNAAALDSFYVSIADGENVKVELEHKKNGV